MLVWLFGLALAQNPPVATSPAAHTERMEDGGLRVLHDRQVPVDVRDAQKMLLEFGETSLYDLTLFFADVRRLNFMIADDTPLKKSTVTLIGHEAMSVDAAWEAYLSAMRAHGLTTSVEGQLVTVVESDEAGRRSHDVRVGRALRGGEYIVTQLIPVENGDLNALSAVVQPLLSKDAELIAYAPSNTLIVTDTASQVKKIAELIAHLSVAASSTQLMRVELEHVPAAEVRDVLLALYPAKPSVKTPKRRGSKSKPVEDDRTVEAVIADERGNALWVLADAEGHRAVASVVEATDVSDGRAGTLHVIPLKYALAEEVKAVLDALRDPSAETAGKGSRTAERALDSGARIAADPETNSLAVVADPADFEALQSMVKQLDVARRQVFVDAVFVDLTSSGGREVALSAHALGGGTNPVTASMQNAEDVSSFGVTTELLAGLAAGVFGSLVDVVLPDGSSGSVPVFGITLRALQTHADVHVMGNPALLVVDHQEAVLTVGQKIPYAQNTVTNFGVSPSFESFDVETELTVTPHINDGELVTLDVSLVVDEVDASAETIEGGPPTTSGRSIQSRVMLEDGQTTVLAGVTSTKSEIIETKVPILGDIPLLGALFRGRRNNNRESNLLVFLTPYIVETPADLLRVRQIKEAQRAAFIERFQDKTGAEWMTSLRDLLEDSYP